MYLYNIRKVDKENGKMYLKERQNLFITGYS